MQSTVHITVNMYKNIPLTVLFASTSNSCPVSTQSDMCMYTHIVHTAEMLVGQKNKITRTAMNAMFHMFNSPGIKLWAE